jgi:hypothetical protein
MKDPKGIGSWPRRLLHVPSMTSLEWTPGNMYGATRAPKYNILSYTWRRYRLDKDGCHRPDDLKSVRGITVRGIEWDIPPIDPSHFTDLEFRNVLGRVAKAGVGPPVNSVWVDVACINQQRGSAVGSLEVGRQDAIFQGADNIFIWLTQCPLGPISKALDDLIATLSTFPRLLFSKACWFAFRTCFRAREAVSPCTRVATVIHWGVVQVPRGLWARPDAHEQSSLSNSVASCNRRNQRPLS